MLHSLKTDLEDSFLLYKILSISVDIRRVVCYCLTCWQYLILILQLSVIFFLLEVGRRDPGLSVRFCCFIGIFSGFVLVSVCILLGPRACACWAEIAVLYRPVGRKALRENGSFLKRPTCSVDAGVGILLKFEFTEVSGGRCRVRQPQGLLSTWYTGELMYLYVVSLYFFEHS